MTLTAGSRLGPYDVISPLGAGGMGEVWSAPVGSVGAIVRRDRALRFPIEGAR